MARASLSLQSYSRILIHAALAGLDTESVARIHERVLHPANPHLTDSKARAPMVAAHGCARRSDDQRTQTTVLAGDLGHPVDVRLRVYAIALDDERLRSNNAFDDEFKQLQLGRNALARWLKQAVGDGEPI